MPAQDRAARSGTRHVRPAEFMDRRSAGSAAHPVITTLAPATGASAIARVFVSHAAGRSNR